MAATKTKPTHSSAVRSAASPRSGRDPELDAVFASLRTTAPILARLTPYADQIAELKRNNVPFALVANRIAEQLKAPPDLVSQALAELYADPRKGKAGRFLGSPQREFRPPIPAADIKAAILAVLQKHNISYFTLKDADIIAQIVKAVPALAQYPRHERNRKIIDACANRKTGLIVRNRQGRREIAIAKAS